MTFNQSDGPVHDIDRRCCKLIASYHCQILSLIIPRSEQWSWWHS